jgi:uncharacterized protein YndB with AHSA1/START domain
MTHPFEIRDEITVDATPDEVWEAIASGPGVDSWLMGRSEIDSASKTATFTMFGEVSSAHITAWEPGHRYATQEDKKPDGTFTAFEWLIEARDGGGAVVRVVHSGLLGEDWEAEYNGLSVGDHAYMTKLAVYLEHFAPRTAKNGLFLPGPITKDSWAAMTAAVGAGTGAADGQPARLTVPGIEPVDGSVEFVVSPSFVGMRTDDAMYVLIHGYNDMVFATAHYFDDRDPSAEAQAWQTWLSGLSADLSDPALAEDVLDVLEVVIVVRRGLAGRLGRRRRGLAGSGDRGLGGGHGARGGRTCPGKRVMAAHAAFDGRIVLLALGGPAGLPGGLTPGPAAGREEERDRETGDPNTDPLGGGEGEPGAELPDRHADLPEHLDRAGQIRRDREQRHGHHAQRRADPGAPQNNVAQQ